MKTVLPTAKNKWCLFHYRNSITLLLVNFDHEIEDVWQDLSHSLYHTTLLKTAYSFTSTDRFRVYPGTIEQIPSILQDRIDCKYYEGAHIDDLTMIAKSGKVQSLSTVTF